MSEVGFKRVHQDSIELLCRKDSGNRGMQIIIDDLKKSFGGRTVLNGISLNLYDGRFIGILGPNGAGKSTLMKIITNQLKESSGKVTWYDKDNNPMPINERAKEMGFVHQNGILDDFLTVKENLMVRGAIRNLKKREILQRITELNAVIEVNSLLNIRYMNLSGGQKRRVDILAALLHKPKLLILDEPTTGIDPEVRAELWTAIHSLRKKDNISVILITHYLEEMKDVDQLIVLLKGKIRYDGGLKKFITDNSENEIDLETRSPNGKSAESRKKYNSLDEKMDILEDAYRNGGLIDFKDNPVSLEKAYLNMLGRFSID